MKIKKTNVKAALIVAVSAVAIFACSKQKVCNPTEDSNHAYDKSTINAREYSNCSFPVAMACSGTMLEFPDQIAFEAAYDCLELKYEDYNDQFESLYTSLSDSAYADLVDSIGFDEVAPLRDFETNNGFHSMRQELETKETAWLALGTFDPTTDPNNTDLDDDILNTLLSREGDIKIGGIIYHYLDDGTIYEISDGDCNTLNALKQDLKHPPANVTRIIFTIPRPKDPAPAATDCIERWSIPGKEDPTSTSKYYWKLAFKNTINRSEPYAVIKNYKYKKRGSSSKWRKDATKCTVFVDGNTNDFDSCIVKSAFSYNVKTKRRKKLRVKRMLPVHSRIQQFDVKGQFSSYGSTINKVLW